MVNYQFFAAHVISSKTAYAGVQVLQLASDIALRGCLWHVCDFTCSDACYFLGNRKQIHAIFYYLSIIEWQYKRKKPVNILRINKSRLSKTKQEDSFCLLNFVFELYLTLSWLQMGKKFGNAWSNYEIEMDVPLQ